VDLAVVSALLRVPSVQMQDYEHAGLQRQLAFRAASRVLAPDAIPVAAMRGAGATERKLFRYPGLKEDYYLADFEPDPGVVAELGADGARVLAVVRPPPETSAYHSPNDLYHGVLDRIAAEDGALAVVIPRTPEQAEEARARPGGSLIVAERAIDAQSLIALADLVVSAGGTMNREAVALGTPVYSIFSGRTGAVDERLIAEGSLVALDDPALLAVEPRSSPPGPRHPRDPGVLVDAVLDAMEG
jgi:predicted glycosyltransferase